LVDGQPVRTPWRSLLTTVLFFAVGGIVLLALWRAVADISVDAVVTALGSLRLTTLLLALAATLLSYALLAGYDVLALRYAGIRLSPAMILLASFCGYGIGNTVGPGTLSGGAVRYRLYGAAGLSPKQIALVVCFISFAFGLGAFVVTSLFVELRAQEIGGLLGIAPAILQMGAGFCLVLFLMPIAGWLIWKNPIRLGALAIKAPSPNVVVAQLALVAADLVAAAAVLWVLLPESPVGFFTFAALYASALILGVLAHIPGGLGVFDVAILYALGTSTPVSSLAAALLAYRAIYFLLPLLLSILLLAGFELGRSLTAAGRDRQEPSAKPQSGLTAECSDIPSSPASRRRSR
jgi:phosphatidylglycerol lysyltransferase